MKPPLNKALDRNRFGDMLPIDILGMLVIIDVYTVHGMLLLDGFQLVSMQVPIPSYLARTG